MAFLHVLCSAQDITLFPGDDARVCERGNAASAALLLRFTNKHHEDAAHEELPL